VDILVSYVSHSNSNDCFYVCVVLRYKFLGFDMFVTRAFTLKKENIGFRWLMAVELILPVVAQSKRLHIDEMCLYWLMFVFAGWGIMWVHTAFGWVVVVWVTCSWSHGAMYKVFCDNMNRPYLVGICGWSDGTKVALQANEFILVGWVAWKSCWTRVSEIITRI